LLFFAATALLLVGVFAAGGGIGGLGSGTGRVPAGVVAKRK
jgi:hypothetical protein